METVEEGCAMLECISDDEAVEELEAISDDEANDELEAISDEEALDELATPCVLVDDMNDCALELN